MRMLLLYFFKNDDVKASGIIKKLIHSASSNGHTMDSVCALTDAENLCAAPYEYVTVVVTCQGMFGRKVSPAVTGVLSRMGSAIGKKGCALVIKSGLFPWKTCNNLMSVMEKEGMLLDYSDVVLNSDHAAYVGKRLG
ncbi:MAG: hypothetical protein LBS97_06380 [Treponema sp.]|nr:hypothetical protein [Treponema sp.]